MQADGLLNVHGEPVLVPHWVRGAESLELVSPTQRSMPVLGLGNSVSTPAGGLTAPVLVVKSFDELTARARERCVAGRTGVYDIEVANQRGEPIALFRGKSHRIKGHVIDAA